MSNFNRSGGNGGSTLRKASSLFVGGGISVKEDKKKERLDDSLEPSIISLPLVTKGRALRASSALGGTWDDTGGVVEFGRPAVTGGGTRSLVGGTFTIPLSSSSAEDDDSGDLESDSEAYSESESGSQSSTSLKGAGYIEGDQGRLVMEYSGDERSMILAARTHSSMLGDGQNVPLSRSQYLMEHDSASGSISSDQSSSSLTDDDAYFKNHPIVPRSLLGGNCDAENVMMDNDHIFSEGSSSDPGEIYEDERKSSDDHADEQKHFGCDMLFVDEDTSDDGESPNPTNTRLKKTDFNWGAYNQERDRLVGQCLISKATIGQQQGKRASSIPMSASSALPDYKNKKTIQSFLKQPLRCRKRLEQDYQLVDATVKGVQYRPDVSLKGQSMQHPTGQHSESGSNSSFADSEHSSTQTSGKSWLSNSTSSGSLDGWESGDSDESTEEDPFLEGSEKSEDQFQLPEGLLARSSFKDVIAELNIGPSGLSAVQQLRQLLEEVSVQVRYGKEEPAEVSAPFFTIQGIEVRNYQGEVQQSVAKYRRNVLKVSDESYLAMLQESKIDFENPKSITIQ